MSTNFEKLADHDVVCVAGISGAGKTTKSREIKNKNADIVCVERDSEVSFITQNVFRHVSDIGFALSESINFINDHKRAFQYNSLGKLYMKVLQEAQQRLEDGLGGFFDEDESIGEFSLGICKYLLSYSGGLQKLQKFHLEGKTVVWDDFLMVFKYERGLFCSFLEEMEISNPALLIVQSTKRDLLRVAKVREDGGDLKNRSAKTVETLIRDSNPVLPSEGFGNRVYVYNYRDGGEAKSVQNVEGGVGFLL